MSNVARCTSARCTSRVGTSHAARSSETQLVTRPEAVMTDASVVRFSYVTIPTAVWVRVGFAAAVAVGGFSMFLDPANGQLDSALATVLLLQMFAVSNGFASAAGRGHFDPILVSGRPRWLVALGAAGAS